MPAFPEKVNSFRLRQELFMPEEFVFIAQIMDIELNLISSQL